MKNATPKKAGQSDWHPADVIAALRKRGITLSSLARAHGLAGSSSLSAALVRSLPKDEKRIADALGVHPKAIWPSRYNPDGTRKLQGFRALQFNAAATARNSQAPAAGGQKSKAA